MADSKYSVTLTGKVRAGRDAPQVWQRVALLLKLDTATFRERVLARLPVTLKAVGYEDARRQQEALSSGGADVLLLAEDDEPRVWIRRDQVTRGPLSMAYARHALREGMLAGDVQACLQGARQWQALKALLARHAPAARSPASAAVSATASSPAVAPRIRTGLPGWALALILVGLSVALIGTLVVLVAVPAWHGYVIRSQVAQGAARAEPSRQAVERYLRQHGRLPVDNAEAGLAPAASIRGPYVASVRIDHGDITVHYGADAASRVRDRHLLLTPHVHGRSVQWTCLSPDLPHHDLPRRCR